MFLAQVEACLNSRPLQPLTDDPSALTPDHFLVESVPMSLPKPALTDTPANRLFRWQHLQRMKDHFWDRRSQEYIESYSEIQIVEEQLSPQSKTTVSHP